MRKNKKMVMSTAFVLALVVFVSTAFAEIISDNGYKQFKESIIDTYTNVEFKGYDSYSLETETTLKDGDETLFSVLVKTKKNIKEKKSDEIREVESKVFDDTYWHYYSDSDVNLTSNDGINYEKSNNYYDEMNDLQYEKNNPFKEDSFKDIERIVDGLVGDLSKHVILKENKGGEKIISGSLNEVQIPSVVNAVVSYGYKSYIRDKIMSSISFSESSTYEDNLKKVDDIAILNEDIFIKNIEGKAELDKNNSIKKLTIVGEVSGLDKNKKEKTLKLESVSVLKDVNSTIVSKPDLSNKKVEIVENDYGYLTEKHIGKWKQDIIVTENDKFVKKGEKTFKIISVNKDTVKGEFSIENSNDSNEKIFEKVTFKLTQRDYIGKINVNDNSVDIILSNNSVGGMLGESNSLGIDIQTVDNLELENGGTSWSEVESIFSGNYIRSFE